MVISTWRALLAPRLKQPFRRNCLKGNHSLKYGQVAQDQHLRPTRSLEGKVGREEAEASVWCACAWGPHTVGERLKQGGLSTGVRTACPSPSPPSTELPPVVKADAPGKCGMKNGKNLYITGRRLTASVPMKAWQLLTLQPNTTSGHKIAPRLPAAQMRTGSRTVGYAARFVELSVHETRSKRSIRSTAVAQVAVQHSSL